MKRLILWKINSAWLPKDPQERVKAQLMMISWSKAEVESGKLLDWGATISGMSGYAVTSMSDEELYVALTKYQPIAEFKIKSVLDINEFEAYFNKAVEQMSK
jgi:hypothetical protein